MVLAVLFWFSAIYLMSRAPSKQTDPNSSREESQGHFYGERAKDIGVVIFGLALVVGPLAAEISIHQTFLR